MGLNISVAIVIALAIVGAWCVEISHDQAHSVKFTETIRAYNDWECAYQNQYGCSVVLEDAAGTEHNVRRRQYSKDFMAVKVEQAGISGWVFAGNGVHVSSKSSP
ncbi:hypothetical protein [Pseudoalteromonas obscura]|uniref:Uncharacterized protein n=1 Tax=Pseudoalteromonas obscura TaxID=3048491 RepID=A0ABT7EFH4_9GAMM|nr:hypothetical protein [Pseudoalteromonas sp. P94(2023)]MDK2594020.1 hypothetical protein [Pseudoalteromonas sp. P94(2023)]